MSQAKTTKLGCEISSYEGKAKCVEVSSPIVTALNQAETAATRVAKFAEELRTKLLPVICPKSTKDAPSDGVDYPSMSSVARNIYDLVELSDQTAVILSNLLQDIEL